ncbi:wall-associated receptor kinase-like 8 [Juglans microcarpa x Juglans regia]|uniref:wall-associated receptor kinase-like 8 n=1 Tax=Juglans microcarpa x Juglans regia TaxID=2249226 RepID=UPI001B7F3594|nr:wall-associated receptor kinase-like 8 [Juglans microcarpa x Juglans regia]
MVLFRMLVLAMCSVNAFARKSNVINSTCSEYCGEVSIPYPFGIGNGCYVGEWFEIVCRSSNDSYDLGFPKPFLKSFDLEMLEIDLVGKVRVNYTIFSSCTNGTSSKNHLELDKSPFVFSDNKNSFVVMGCNNSASLRSLFHNDSNSFDGGCESSCDKDPFINGSRCYATNCCQTTIPSHDLQVFSTTIETKGSGRHNISGCKYAFMVDQDWFETIFTEPSPNMSVPVILEWGLDNTSFYYLPTRKNSTAREYANSTAYSCTRWSTRRIYNDTITVWINTTWNWKCGCRHGYRGNPYLLGGCRDVNELCENMDGSYYTCFEPPRSDDQQMSAIIIGISTSFGVLCLLFGGWWSHKLIRKRKMIKQKEKFFKRNGGLLLQQQLSSSDHVNVENNKLFIIYWFQKS